MNAAQKTYMLAKAHHEALKQEADNYEFRWLQDHGIQNPDGTTPKHIWCWITEGEGEGRITEEWEKTCKKLDADPEMRKLSDEVREAYHLLWQAEDEMIRYCIRIIPEKERAILWKNKDQLKYREKLIDLTFRADLK